MKCQGHLVLLTKILKVTRDPSVESTIWDEQAANLAVEDGKKLPR